MGPSGSGKSTLLYQVSGMDRADSGEVWMDGTEVCSLSEDDRARLRLSQMGFVFQQMNMLKNLNLLDNILLPACRLNRGKTAGKEAERRVRMLMGKMGIAELAGRRITEVSGGQLQRACKFPPIWIFPVITCFIFSDVDRHSLMRFSLPIFYYSGLSSFF